MGAAKATGDFDWKAFYSQLNRAEQAEGLTSRELCERIGCDEATLRKRLRSAVASGQVLVGKAVRPTIVPWREQVVPVYRVAKRK